MYNIRDELKNNLFTMSAEIQLFPQRCCDEVIREGLITNVHAVCILKSLGSWLIGPTSYCNYY